MLHFYLWIFVQIVLESLPVSSSGHLLLLERALSKLGYGTVFCEQQINFLQISFFSSIDILMHLLHGPTVIVVACFFFYRWFFLVRHMNYCYPIIIKIIVLTGIADIMTAIFYIIFKMFPLCIPVVIGFFITGILLYILRWMPRGTASWTWQKAVILGCVQGCALLPGISRFASVYVGARWLGLPVRKAFEITWLIQWPLIMVAFLQGVYTIHNYQLYVAFASWDLLSVVGLGMFCAYIALYLVYRMVFQKRLWWLSLYMVIPIILWIVFIS